MQCHFPGGKFRELIQFLTKKKERGGGGGAGSRGRGGGGNKQKMYRQVRLSLTFSRF